MKGLVTVGLAALRARQDAPMGSAVRRVTVGVGLHAACDGL
ncbi:hypothetical protein [Streptomyces sioyaensis]